MADNQVLIQIKGDVADINAKLADLKGNIGKVADQAKQVATSTRLSFAVMATGINQAIGVIQQVYSSIQVFIDNFAAAETAQMKLAKAMQNQGDYTREAFEELDNYASQIQRTTAYEDDYVKSRMATLKTYGMTNDEIKETIVSVLDLATANREEGMSAESAAALLGRAYAGQTERLKRYGIIIDETIPKKERFAEVLRQIQARFGGAAAAEIETYSGQVAQLKNQLGDLAEIVGKRLLQAFGALQVALDVVAAGFWSMVQQILGGMSWLTGRLADFARWMGLDGIGDSLAAAGAKLQDGAAFASDKFEENIGLVSKHFEQMKKVGDIDAHISKLKTGAQSVWKLEDEGAVKLADQWRKQLDKMRADTAKATETDPMLQRIIDIDREAAGLLEIYAKIKGAREEIGKWQAAQYDKEIIETAKRELDELLRIEKDRTETLRKRQAAAEAEINALITAQDVAENEGAYRRNTLDERIRLTKQLLALREGRLGQIDPKDTLAWNQQVDAINKTRIEIAELRAEQRPVLMELKKYAEDATDVWRQVGSAVGNVFRGMEDAIVNFVKTGKLNFSEFAQSVIADLIRIQVRSAVTGPLASGMGSAIKDIVSLVAWGGFHKGGMGTEPSFYRLMPNIATLPRYHKGLGPGERMSVTTDDEMILTPGQQRRMTELMRGSAPSQQAVRVEIINRTNQSVQATSAKGEFNGQEYIVSVVLDAINRDAYGMRRGLKGV